MKTDDNIHINQIMKAIRQIVSYLLESSTDDLARNKMIQDAILRQLEIAGQASRSLSLLFRQQHQGVSCGQLLGIEDGAVAGITKREILIDSQKSLIDVESEHIKKILSYTGGNRTKAAHILGISRVNLISKIQKYKLE